MSRQIVLDTETTGLSADNGDRVIELGCVELLNRKLSGNDLHIYFNPERESHEDALKVHGLTTDFLRDKPKFAAAAEEIVDYLRGAELIIHNAAFDVGFLNKEFERIGLPPLKAFVSEITDTLAMAKMVYPGKRNSLDALCDRFGVDRSNRTFRRQARRPVACRRLHQSDARPGCVADRCRFGRARVGRQCRRRGLEQLHAAGDRRIRAGTVGAPGCAWPARQVQQGEDDFSAAGCTAGKRCGIIAGFAGDGERQMRAVSSGVEHSIHTAGVPGSKPGPPTNDKRGFQADSAPALQYFQISESTSRCPICARANRHN